MGSKYWPHTSGHKFENEPHLCGYYGCFLTAAVGGGSLLVEHDGDAGRGHVGGERTGVGFEV